MGFSTLLLLDAQRLLRELESLCVITLHIPEHGNIVENFCYLDMVFAELLGLDSVGFHAKLLNSGVTLSFLHAHACNVVQHGCNFDMTSA